MDSSWVMEIHNWYTNNRWGAAQRGFSGSAHGPGRWTGLVGRQAEPTSSSVLPPGKHLVRRNIQEVWELLHWIVKLSDAHRYHLCKLTTELAACAGKGALADGPAPGGGVLGRLKAKNHLHPKEPAFQDTKPTWRTFGKQKEWVRNNWLGRTHQMRLKYLQNNARYRPKQTGPY